VKLKPIAVLLAVALSIYPLGHIPAMAQIKGCQVFNFKEFFIADYNTGSTWRDGSVDLEITWSASMDHIYDEAVSRPFTQRELGWIRTAIQSWDNALATVSFREVTSSELPQIAIGFVTLESSEAQSNAMAYWNTWVSNGVRHRATIKLKASEVQWFSKKSQFIHSVQHEFGNILGLGDLKPNSTFASALEDPWQPPYGRSNLSSIDVAMIRQLYGEPICSNFVTSKS
jgi:hypothetical protein